MWADYDLPKGGGGYACSPLRMWIPLQNNLDNLKPDSQMMHHAFLQHTDMFLKSLYPNLAMSLFYKRSHVHLQWIENRKVHWWRLTPIPTFSDRELPTNLQLRWLLNTKFYFLPISTKPSAGIWKIGPFPSGRGDNREQCICPFQCHCTVPSRIKI